MVLIFFPLDDSPGPLSTLDIRLLVVSSLLNSTLLLTTPERLVDDIIGDGPTISHLISYGLLYFVMTP